MSPTAKGLFLKKPPLGTWRVRKDFCLFLSSSGEAAGIMRNCYENTSKRRKKKFPLALEIKNMIKYSTKGVEIWDKNMIIVTII